MYLFLEVTDDEVIYGTGPGSDQVRVRVRNSSQVSTDLLFATPALCQSRVCGPVVDIAEQVKERTDADVSFIHMEIFEDNQFDKGPREQVQAYNLPTEPWLFVVDSKGTIDTVFEGPFSADELEEAVGNVS